MTTPFPRSAARCAGAALALLLAGAAAAPAEQRVQTPYGGARVITFDRRETRQLFEVRGTAVVVFDGYAPDAQVVLVLTTRKGQCVDSGRLDPGDDLPVIRLTGKCSQVTGLLLHR